MRIYIVIGNMIFIMLLITCIRSDERINDCLNMHPGFLLYILPGEYDYELYKKSKENDPEFQKLSEEEKYNKYEDVVQFRYYIELLNTYEKNCEEENKNISKIDRMLK
ncbi:MAG: hypothetical protein KatS3mg129_2302 [Leptospiraceae bacterium]|nr:MAG: hypothetical protein KatS3mg129_2302 [Leptospiraceae bacterium]